MDPANAHGRKRLGAGATHVLRILQRLTAASAKRGIPFAFPGRDWLARETGGSLRSIDRWLGELRRGGWLRTRRARVVHGTSEYYLADAALAPTVAGVLTPAVAAALPTGGPAVQPPRSAEALSPAPLEGSAKVEEAGKTAAAAPLRLIRTAKTAAQGELFGRDETRNGRSGGGSMDEPGRDEDGQAAVSPPVISLLDAAVAELRNCGVEEPMLSRLAQADPHLAIVAAAHFRAIRQAPLGKSKPAGLLVKMCQDPRSFGFKRLDVSVRPKGDPFEVWAAPDGSPVHRLREKQARAAAEGAKKRVAEIEQSAADSAARDRRVRAKQAWESLDEFERAGIDKALGERFPPTVPPTGGVAQPLISPARPALWQEQRENLALQLVDAMADAARWQAVPEPERQAAEAIAAGQEPLFAQDARRMQWLRWLALETVRRQAKGKR